MMTVFVGPWRLVHEFSGVPVFDRRDSDTTDVAFTVAFQITPVKSRSV